ncbi:MAG: hypothetical protein ACRCWM_02360 [Sarcina sp.]
MYIDVQKLINEKNKLNLSYKSIAEKVTLASERQVSRQTVFDVFSGRNKSYFNVYYICQVMGLDINEVYVIV